MIYEIKYALGGGFGGTKNKDWEEIEADSKEEAEKEAFERACNEYESYAGMYGLRDVGQIIEEDEVDEDDAQEIFEEERERWLDYCVREKQGEN